MEEILEVEGEVCGKRKILEGMKRKVNGWCSGEIRRIVERKDECFLLWRRARSE